jgi:hypothetical protein
VRSKIIVQDGSGNEIGQIVQENAIGKIHFGLHAGGRRIGSLNAENWRAWTSTSPTRAVPRWPA